MRVPDRTQGAWGQARTVGLCARDVGLADAQGTRGRGREGRLGLQHGGPRMAVVCSVGHRKPFKCL